MNLQEKIQVIGQDVDILKKGIDRVVEKYPLSIGILVRGNKSGLSVTIDKNFDKVPMEVFTRKRLAQS